MTVEELLMGKRAGFMFDNLKDYSEGSDIEGTESVRKCDPKFSSRFKADAAINRMVNNIFLKFKKSDRFTSSILSR